MSKIKTFVLYSSTLLLLILLDQLSKTYLISYLKTKPNFILEILPFLDFVYAWNYGISFGLFKQYYQYSNYVLLVLNSFIVIYLVNMLIKSKSKLSIYGLNLIIGGAIGNLIDRIVRGAVFDFIYFNYQEFSFPAFNLADSFISIGAAFFIYEYFFSKKPLAQN
ncbi:MAG: signal peptidase II [Rickettsiaceae bacterium]